VYRHFHFNKEGIGEANAIRWVCFTTAFVWRIGAYFLKRAAVTPGVTSFYLKITSLTQTTLHVAQFYPKRHLQHDSIPFFVLPSRFVTFLPRHAHKSK